MPSLLFQPKVAYKFASMADPRFLDDLLAAETDELRRRMVAAYRDLVRGTARGDAAELLRQEMVNIFEAMKDAPP
jgi:hypothetical protein